MIIPKDDAPIWRETFFLYVRNPKRERLSASVEHSTMTKDLDPLLGRATVDDLEALCDGKVHDLQLQLTGYETLGILN